MKNVNAKFAVPVKVVVNTMDKNRDRWAQIQHGATGEVLHNRRIFDGSQRRAIMLLRKSNSV
jgi:hypothetical protein